MLVAGGSGNRMNSKIPKQFIVIKGYPVLMHTVDVFYRYDQSMKLWIILPEAHILHWSKLCEKYNFSIPHEVRSGGETRFQSVKKNIFGVPDDFLVAIHDGVRPLVDLLTIDRCFQTALKYGNAVPCVAIRDTMRMVQENSSKQVNRDSFREIQTPQVFHAHIIKKAYSQQNQENFTDDAGVVESLGYLINLVEGNSANIKITYPGDIKIASALLK